MGVKRAQQTSLLKRPLKQVIEKFLTNKVDNWNIDTISPTELRSVLYFHQLFAWECTNSVRRSELLNTYLLGEEFLYSFPTFQMFAIHPFHKIEPFRLGKWTKIDTTGGNQRYDQLVVELLKKKSNTNRHQKWHIQKLWKIYYALVGMAENLWKNISNIPITFKVPDQSFGFT